MGLRVARLVVLNSLFEVEYSKLAVLPQVSVQSSQDPSSVLNLNRSMARARGEEARRWIAFGFSCETMAIAESTGSRRRRQSGVCQTFVLSLGESTDSKLRHQAPCTQRDGGSWLACALARSSVFLSPVRTSAADSMLSRLLCR